MTSSSTERVLTDLNILDSDQLKALIVEQLFDEGFQDKFFDEALEIPGRSADMNRAPASVVV